MDAILICFYWTGLTGFLGFFLAAYFPEESKPTQSA
jgi:hypothetical protein